MLSLKNVKDYLIDHIFFIKYDWTLKHGSFPDVEIGPQTLKKKIFFFNV